MIKDSVNKKSRKDGLICLCVGVGAGVGAGVGVRACVRACMFARLFLKNITCRAWGISHL